MRRRVRSRRARPPASSSSTPIPAAWPMARRLLDAYRKALRCDPVSAFGGIVALNRPLDARGRARDHRDLHRGDHRARRRARTRSRSSAAKKNLRLLLAGGLPDPRAAGLDGRNRRRRLAGADRATMPSSTTRSLKVVTKRAPTDAELRDLRLRLPRRQACQVERHRLRQGRRHRRHRRRPDEPRRCGAHRRAQGARTPPSAPALREPLTKGSVVASDAFFPFADGLLVAIEAGATAVIQPGGSVRDDEVIKAADEHGIAMVFTGMRHFRH